MKDIIYVNCFDTISEHDKKNIIEFWNNEGLSSTPNFNPEQRLKQIAFIAKYYSPQENQELVIGISSYYLDRDEYLDAYFYYLRASVSKNKRQSGIAAQLVDKMTRQLESNTLAKNDTSILGAVIVYENPYLQKFFTGAVVESPSFYFYAFDKKNCPRRVHYFKNAKILN